MSVLDKMGGELVVKYEVSWRCAPITEYIRPGQSRYSTPVLHYSSIVVYTTLGQHETGEL